MKQLIVLCAIFPLMLILISQFGVMNLNHSRAAQVHECVYAAVQSAKSEGYFTQDNIDAMRSSLAKAADVSEDEIIIDVDQIPKYRRNEYNENELIHYRVEVPVKKVMAGNKLLGISDQENQGKIIIDDYTASERLMP